MASEYTEEQLTHLYEYDQSALYSKVNNHHTDIMSDASKAKVRRIIKVMIYLGVITSIEAGLGLWDHHVGIFHHHGILATIFLVMTLFKAYLIVDIFMHLGDEFRNFVMVVLIPLILLLWAIVALMSDGNYDLHMNNTRANTISPTEQVMKAPPSANHFK